MARPQYACAPRRPGSAGRRAAPLLIAIALGACQTPSDVENQPECRVSGVAVATAESQIDVGATTTATATVSQQNCGTVAPVWSSDHPAIATVSPAGLILGVAAGTATIRATASGVAGTAQVTVRACTITDVTVTPPNSTIAVGGRVTLTATVTRQACTNVTVVWDSQSPTVATVAPNGDVMGVGPGTATIRATANGVRTGSAQITVQSASTGAAWRVDRLVVAGAGDVPRADLAGVVAFDASNVFVAGWWGVFRWDGATWTRILPTGLQIEGFWGSSPANLIVVGLSGLVRRWDGSTWSSMSAGTNANLAAVWGAAANAVFAVGAQGTIRRFDGTSWTGQNAPTAANLRAVHGSGATNVMAVGENGTILRYDGTTWTALSSPTAATIYAVRVMSANAAWIADADGRVFRFDGSTWTESIQFNAVPRSMWGDAPNNLFLVGNNGFAAHFDGTTWKTLESKAAYHLLGAGGSGGTAYAVGYATVVALTPGATTRLAYVPDVTSVWMIDGANAVATTSAGIIWRWSNGAWQFHDTGTGHRFLDVWASGPNDIVAVGGTFPFRSGGVIARFNGTSWSMATPFVPYLTTVWGSGPNDIWAAGGFDGLAHWDGTTWTAVSAGAFGTIEAMWGTSPSNLVGVGRNGAGIRYDGTSWTFVPLGTNATALGIWAAGPAQYYAVLTSGRIMRFDGAAWTEVLSTQRLYSGIAGASATEILVLDILGGITKFDGQSWTRVFDGVVQEDVRAIHGAGGRYIAVGLGGLAMISM